MIYAVSAAAGFLYGAVAGTLKYWAIWRKLVRGNGQGCIKDKGIYWRMSVSSLVNISTLLLLFAVRQSLPLDFTATAISAAIGLSVFGRCFSIRTVLKKEERDAEI